MSPRSLFVLAALSLFLGFGSAGSAEAPAKPDAATFTKPEQTLAQVPKPLLFSVRGGPKQNEAVTQITDLLRSKVEGHMATLKLKVDRVEKYRNKNEQEDRYRIKAEDGQLVENGTHLRVYIWVHFDPAENTKVIAKKKSDDINVTGKIATAFVSGQNNPALHIDLEEAKLN
jgi:hypothetical protein